MDIKLNSIGRRFNREWIFEEINYTFEQGKTYSILGQNGSGKSTLLQIIAGNLTPSAGSIIYSHNGREIDIDDVYQSLSIAAPYLELIEEFSLKELIEFHFKFKGTFQQFSTQDVIALTGLEKSSHKLLKHFSSGMKQRTKLALAMCSDTPVVLLDEPATNLDASGIIWYKSLVQRLSTNRTIIVCSNQEYEYDFCEFEIQVSDYKRA